jgi:hypothetical protein
MRCTLARSSLCCGSTRERREDWTLSHTSDKHIHTLKKAFTQKEDTNTYVHVYRNIDEMAPGMPRLQRLQLLPPRLLPHRLCLHPRPLRESDVRDRTNSAKRMCKHDCVTVVSGKKQVVHAKDKSMQVVQAKGKWEKSFQSCRFLSCHQVVA